MVDDNKKRKPGRPPGSKNKTALVRLEKPGAAPLVAVCKNPSKSADAIACLRRVQGYFRMQTIARSMADTGPMGGRYMPHAPPIVGRYGKRPHSRMRRLQLRTVHDLSVHHARLPLAPPQKNPLDKLSGCAMRALPITRCSTDLSAFTRAICAFVSVPLLVSGGPPSTRFSVFGTGRSQLGGPPFCGPVHEPSGLASIVRSSTIAPTALPSTILMPRL